ncbi:MAG: hypothetical protein HYZ54_02360, partial [Ignavibacteriae bacterium]|nr:hypothetical protein [Ignavibacteriota bacterium]
VGAAVAAYQAAGWGAQPNRQLSTAEGPNINNNNPPTVRGNIRVGVNTALPIIYNGSSFFNYPNNLDL